MRFLLVLMLLLAACAPAVQRTPEEEAAYQQQLQAQREKQARLLRIQQYGLSLRAECYARDGQLRINRLQQGPNFCLFKALTAPEFGELVRVKIVEEYDFTNKPPITYNDAFEAVDNVWNGNRIAIPQPLLLPDSLTGALLSGAIGISKVAVMSLYEAKAGWLNVVGFDPTKDPRIAPLLDPQGNLRTMGSKFNNLGTRPYQVRVQIEACSDICMKSSVLVLETR